MIIGITGKSGTGKTTVSEYLGSILNYMVIHGDDLAHEVLTLDFYNEILSMFDLPCENEVDRKKLGSLLFNNKKIMSKYNKMINERIIKRFKEIVKDEKNYIIDWNFLTVSELWNLCDKKILLVADDNTRRNRVLARDNISDEYFNSRDKAGLEYNEQDFDYVITSDDVLTKKFDLERLMS